MASKYIPGGNANKKQLMGAFRSGKAVGKHKASGFVIENDLILIYASIIVALHEQGWDDDRIAEFISNIQETTARYFDQGYGFYEFVNLAKELTGIELQYSPERVKGDL